MRIESEKNLETIRQDYIKRLYYPDATQVNIGMAMCGIANGAQAAFDKASGAFSENDSIRINQTGCIGFCEVEPLVEIFQNGKPRVIYKYVSEDKILDVIQDYVEGRFNSDWILGQMRDPRNILPPHESHCS